MTADMTVLRDELAGVLRTLDGLKGHAYAQLPGRLNPPLALVAPGDPYLEPADLAGGKPGAWRIRHEVLVLVAPGDNRVQATAMDELIEDALAVLLPYGITDVGQPYPLQIGDGPVFFAARIRLTTTR